MNPSDPKQLTEHEVEVIELLADATMGDVNESKRAFAELLRRGINVLAGTEAAERLIEILDPPKGRPNKKTGRSLYSTRDGKHANQAKKNHQVIRREYEILQRSGDYKTKEQLYHRLAERFSYSASRIKQIILKKD
jgi:hypothetical protein